MQALEKAATYLNYIRGEWTASATGQTESSINPANRNEVVGRFQSSDARDVDLAVAAAKAAQQAWRRLPAPARGEFLYKAANAIERRLDEIALTMTREMGKTLPEAKGETARGVALLRYYAGEGMRKVGDVIPSTDGEALMYTTRVPLGVVGVITPWNFPVAIPIWKMAPALVYGNTVVLKPAQETSITAALVVECFAEAGFPAGVVNLVTGRGSLIGPALTDHPDVQAITFTGSNEVGKLIGRKALERGAKYQLEMGGKNPVIVLPDADLQLAVEATISGGLRSTGQKCTATSRVFVHKGIYEQFKALLVEKTMQLKLGNGLEPGVWMGPCSSERQLDTVLSYIDKGVAEGAELLCGGKRPAEDGLADGFYVEPTIFDKVDPASTIAQEEIFGPVLALIEVGSLQEALDKANDIHLGLSASIFTKDIGSMLSFINEMDAGLVRVNAETAGVELQAPFGGMKQSSSHSREQGQAAMEFFTAVKTVFIKA
ncbi:aldehyde dehydrogenase family protein [Paenibacillus sp. GD4]|uniref:alpha-ketoglutaric semialdehyde dehydrogenase GucD n=1 Tax=Paenibacillus sp. GD4 TaxID=3068890 RepID=UPI0027964EC6|nr:alpha-ketoglutaric semialdehyde dehydrogenase GucD [Paenibacillus sp. GD4]MDQ1914215.1 aldehyde dehydrogenase family protein [Paenibacillus sp. GD4]